ncbi:PD-(D/E)XK nuclease family protein [Aerococcaceae bacterium zg-B36]|uniref:PD-(D/E)XK nuclease family protein n=1 Tax=Aerococcaceae bacterium zg-252 TaxID=2796928 RepID=UPI001BD902C8|nr:PD-(D/E)XK nuclease family protein [Aerococcaceae bacterium zg-B36]
MARLSLEQLDELKQRYNVDRIWSYSRLNTYVDQKWVYRMTYLEDVRIRTDNVYTKFGTICHDLVQSVYEHDADPKTLLGKFKDEVMSWQLKDDPTYHFSSEKIQRGYIDNLSHYFENIKTLPYELIIEKPVKIHFKHKEKNIVFVGYIDGMYWDEEGNLHILDFKTSSKSGYSGKQLKEHSKQLMLYSIGIMQTLKASGKDILYENIKPRFDMMKYVTVKRLQKNGKWTSSLQERVNWVESQQKQIRKMLLECDVDPLDIDSMIVLAVADNTLDTLPQYVQDRFIIEQGYIDVEFNEEVAKEVEEWAVKNIVECEEKEKGDWDVEFSEPVIDESNEFYFTVLAKQVLPYHKGWQEQQQLKAANGTDVDLDELEALFA